MNNNVLFVDDDENILDAYKRQLRQQFHIDTAQGGEQGLKTVNSRGPYAVIVSDLRMPGMDGIQFLSRVKEISPDSVRMMLTGYGDLQTAIEAVNESNIFRFLTKPCKKDVLTTAIDAGIEQYRLIGSEKELLEKTLKLAESLKKKKRNLQKKNSQLKRLEELKTDLFNMLIHDLKGPISEMVANLDILSYTVSDENREYVEYAETGCNTLYSMVSNLLNIARLEEGKLELVYEEIEPEELIKEAFAGLFGLVKMRGLIFLEKFPSSETRNFFWGDRKLLIGVLQNLLTNAINYSPHGEMIEVGYKYLTSRKIEFFVKDNGPGVNPKYDEAIFDKFFQLAKITDDRTYTTGLGLTFCKMAVEAHRGKIGVESESLRGSRFFFHIPLERKRRKRGVVDRYRPLLSEINT